MEPFLNAHLLDEASRRVLLEPGAEVSVDLVNDAELLLRQRGPRQL